MSKKSVHRLYVKYHGNGRSWRALRESYIGVRQLKSYDIIGLWWIRKLSLNKVFVCGKYLFKHKHLHRIGQVRSLIVVSEWSRLVDCFIVLQWIVKVLFLMSYAMCSNELVSFDQFRSVYYVLYHIELHGFVCVCVWFTLCHILSHVIWMFSCVTCAIHWYVDCTMR